MLLFANPHPIAHGHRQFPAPFRSRGLRIGSAVAAILALKEQQLVEHFREHGALSTATARTLNALSISDDDSFRSLRVRDVIREGSAGAYYFDEARWTAVRSARRRLRTVLLIVTAGVLIALLVFARE